ncbi:MAG: hypothetical protein ACYDDU_06795 [Dermatophilaceae bacterium]
MTTRRDPFKVEFSDMPGPTHWPSLLPDDARQAWADLCSWVEALVDRFGLETRVVPPCWYRHNPLVEGLSALRDHERISFAPNASPTAAVDWFRALREIEHRLSEVCARTQCSVNEHRADPPRSWQRDPGQWLSFVQADVHDREQQVIDGYLLGG